MQKQEKNYQVQTPENLALTKILQKFGKTSIPLASKKIFKLTFAHAPLHSFGFWQMNKIGNIAIIANLVFLFDCHFLLYLHQLMLVKMKWDVSQYKLSQFLMAQLKQSWQYWNSCIVENLWKILLYFFTDFHAHARIPL